MRRTNKLIEWMQRPENVVYVDVDSIPRMVKLIDLIIWALERSIPEDEWKPFETKFNEARYYVADIFETEEQWVAGFHAAIPMVVATLREYLAYIEKSDLGVRVD